MHVASASSRIYRNKWQCKLASPNIYQVPFSNSSDVLMFVPVVTRGRACFSGVHIFRYSFFAIHHWPWCSFIRDINLLLLANSTIHVRVNIEILHIDKLKGAMPNRGGPSPGQEFGFMLLHVYLLSVLVEGRRDSTGLLKILQLKLRRPVIWF